MKRVRIYRDAETGRLGYRVREGQQAGQRELTQQTDIRKLRRQLRRSEGKSIILDGLGR